MTAEKKEVLLVKKGDVFVYTVYPCSIDDVTPYSNIIVAKHDNDKLVISMEEDAFMHKLGNLHDDHIHQVLSNLGALTPEIPEIHSVKRNLIDAMADYAENEPAN